jgi:hypothetical protein
MNHLIRRGLPAALALAFAFAAQAQQSNNPTGPGARQSQQAGEAYPNDPKAGTDKGAPKVVQDAEKSRPAQATKRVAKKAGNAVSDTAGKAADATRDTGNAIAKRLPPAPSGAPKQ